MLQHCGRVPAPPRSRGSRQLQRSLGWRDVSSRWPGAVQRMTTVLALVGAALVITDFIIKIVAIGLIPRDRKPSAMAWLILILAVPFAGFFLFLLLGRTNVGAGRLARQREADDAMRAATERLPVSPVEGPVYLGSMATLNRRLGSLPFQGGNLVELVPGYTDAVDGMTEAVRGATTTVEVEFYITAWDEVTGPFYEALVDAAARGVTVRLLIDHVVLEGYPATRSSSPGWRAPASTGTRCFPSGHSRESFSVRLCAITASSWSSTAGSVSPAPRT
jgi:hypothetical protein